MESSAFPPLDSSSRLTSKSPIKFQMADTTGFLRGVRDLETGALKVIGSTSVKLNNVDTSGTYQDSDKITLAKHDDPVAGGQEYRLRFSGQFPQHLLSQGASSWVLSPKLQENLATLDPDLTVRALSIVNKTGRAVGGVESVYSMPEDRIHYSFFVRFPVDTDTRAAEQDFMKNFQAGLDIYRMWMDSIYGEAETTPPPQTIVINSPREIDYKSHSESPYKKIDPREVHVDFGDEYHHYPADVYEYDTDEDKERQYIPLSPKLLDENNIIVIEGVTKQDFENLSNRRVRIVMQKSPEDGKYIIYGLYLDDKGKPTGRVALRAGSLEEQFDLLDPSNNRNLERLPDIGTSSPESVFCMGEAFDSQGRIKEGWGHIKPPMIGEIEERTIFEKVRFGDGDVEREIITFSRIDSVFVVRPSPVAPEDVLTKPIVTVPVTLPR